MKTCAKCGFLSLQGLETKSLYEAEAGFRKTAALPKPPIGMDGSFEQYPYCYKEQVNFEYAVEQAARESGTFNDPKKLIQNELEADRTDCSGFSQWMRGYSPKEHVQFSLVREVELRNEIARLDQVAREERHHNENRKLTLIGILCSLAGSGLLTWILNWLFK